MKRSALVLLSYCLLIWACNGPKEEKVSYRMIQGETMGTTYHITYLDSLNRDLQPPVDSLLEAVNRSMSTYIQSSLISQFNASQDTSNWMTIDQHFANVFGVAVMTYFKTGGAFDPTVMPLVKAWGFGGEGGAFLDSTEVDSLVGLVDFLSIMFEPVTIRERFEHSNLPEEGENRKLKKTRPEVQLDFSAVAKGYGVDVVGELLEHYGVEDYLVEIGGEVRVKGYSQRDTLWQLGINRPVEDRAEQNEQEAVIQLKNESLATSGNYRNYKLIDGQKVVHTINPKTGYPEISNTLSVSVVAPLCAKADAFATALMVLGYEKGLEIAEAERDLEAFFIYADSTGKFKTVATTGMKEKLLMVRPD